MDGGFAQVGIHQQDPLALLRERHRQIHDRCRFSLAKADTRKQQRLDFSLGIRELQIGAERPQILRQHGGRIDQARQP